MSGWRWPGGLRTQLILGVTVVHVLLVATFTLDVVQRQSDFLASQSSAEAAALARALAATSSSWVLANDLEGISEVVGTLQPHADLRYAMVTSTGGLVLAHTDPSLVGRWLKDRRSREVLAGEPAERVVHAGADVLDVAAPVRSSTGDCVGWARIGLGQEAIAANLASVRRTGIVLGVLATLLGVAFATVVGFRLSTRVRRLLVVSQAVRDGRTDVRSGLSGRDELGTLGAGMDSMIEALGAREQENARLGAELVRSQKIEAVGRLAGGVAHDFNNVLSVVLTCVAGLRDDLAAGRPANPEDVDEIGKAGERARDLTRQLLAFARRQVVAPVPLDLNVVVRGSENMLRRVLGESVTLSLDLEPELGVTRCDPGQIEQILLNLAINARDAMPSGGRLTIETRNALVAEHQPVEDPEHPRGRWVRLRIRDDGQGMTQEVLAHLFEPFFTTKELGRGTGLGLASVHGIVAQAGGHIHVESEPGRGTTFEVCLPRVDLPPVEVRAEPPVRARGGTETVLVVEDDEQVRRATARTLSDAGYRVLVAANASEALSLLDHEATRPDLVVTDVVMPGQDGKALVAALRRRHGALKALYVSGYPRDVISHLGILDQAVDFLPKPFTGDALRARVRQLLDEP